MHPLHPRNLTARYQKMAIFKRSRLFQTFILGIHDSFREGIPCSSRPRKLQHIVGKPEISPFEPTLSWSVGLGWDPLSPKKMIHFYRGFQLRNFLKSGGYWCLLLPQNLACLRIAQINTLDHELYNWEYIVLSVWSVGICPIASHLFTMSFGKLPARLLEQVSIIGRRCSRWTCQRLNHLSPQSDMVAFWMHEAVEKTLRYHDFRKLPCPHIDNMFWSTCELS